MKEHQRRISLPSKHSIDVIQCRKILIYIDRTLAYTMRFTVQYIYYIFIDDKGVPIRP